MTEQKKSNEFFDARSVGRKQSASEYASDKLKNTNYPTASQAITLLPDSADMFKAEDSILDLFTKGNNNHPTTTTTQTSSQESLAKDINYWKRMDEQIRASVHSDEIKKTVSETQSKMKKIEDLLVETEKRNQNKFEAVEKLLHKIEQKIDALPNVGDIQKEFQSLKKSIGDIITITFEANLQSNSLTLPTYSPQIESTKQAIQSVQDNSPKSTPPAVATYTTNEFESEPKLIDLSKNTDTTSDVDITPKKHLSWSECIEEYKKKGVIVKNGTDIESGLPYISIEKRKCFCKLVEDPCKTCKTYLNNWNLASGKQRSNGGCEKKPDNLRQKRKPSDKQDTPGAKKSKQEEKSSKKRARDEDASTEDERKDEQPPKRNKGQAKTSEPTHKSKEEQPDPVAQALRDMPIEIDIVKDIEMSRFNREYLPPMGVYKSVGAEPMPFAYYFSISHLLSTGDKLYPLDEAIKLVGILFEGRKPLIGKSEKDGKIFKYVLLDVSDIDDRVIEALSNKLKEKRSSDKFKFEDFMSHLKKSVKAIKKTL
jgi:hypothetical protein